MIHIRNELKLFGRITPRDQIVFTECKDMKDGHIDMKITAQICHLPLQISDGRASACLYFKTKYMLKRAKEEIPASEIVSTSLCFTSPDFDKKYTGRRRDGCFMILMGVIPRKSRAMLPKHRYDVKMIWPGPVDAFMIDIIAPLKFSVTKFRRLFEGMQLHMRVHLRRITRVEISADCRHLSSTIISSPIWVRVFLIRESNTQMQHFITTATEEELVGGERFRVYYDKNNRHLNRALGKLMSVIFASQETTALALNIRPAAAATQKYVVYSQIVGAKIERCDDARIRCSIREPFGVERMCPVSYFCDGAFPFRDLDITYTLLF